MVPPFSPRGVVVVRRRPPARIKHYYERMKNQPCLLGPAGGWLLIKNAAILADLPYLFSLFNMLCWLMLLNLLQPVVVLLVALLACFFVFLEEAPLIRTQKTKLSITFTTLKPKTCYNLLYYRKKYYIVFLSKWRDGTADDGAVGEFLREDCEET